MGAALSVLIWRQVGINFSTQFYVRLWPVLLLFPVAYAASGLYPGFGRNPADELRKLSVATSVVYAALAVTIFLLKDAATYSRGTFLLAWGNTLILVPLLRSVVRSRCSRNAWWGNPVVIVGARDVTVALAATLEGQPELGFKPVAILEDPRYAASMARGRGIRHVILAMAEIPRETRRIIFEECTDSFSGCHRDPGSGGLFEPVGGAKRSARDARAGDSTTAADPPGTGIEAHHRPCASGCLQRRGRPADCGDRRFD